MVLPVGGSYAIEKFASAAWRQLGGDRILGLNHCGATRRDCNVVDWA